MMSFFARCTKVNDVISDCVLWSEMDATHPMRSQMSVKFDLGGSHVAAQFFCALKDFRCGAFMQLDPLPTSPN